MNNPDKRRPDRLRVDFGLVVRNYEKGRTCNASLENISLGGACVVGEMACAPGDTLRVSIPTHMCPSLSGLPAFLYGTGVVKRVRAFSAATHEVAIQFSPALSESIDFAAFMGSLDTACQPALPSA
jgi:hypothetical protein